MNKPLEHKLALVTGASRGIGAAIAARLARDGAAVLVNYSASADRADAVVKAILAEGGQAESICADLSTSEGVSGLLGAIDGAFDGRFKGRLDILVNNAGTVKLQLRSPTSPAPKRATPMAKASRSMAVGTPEPERSPKRDGARCHRRAWF